MALSAKQVAELEKPLDMRHVAGRTQSGRKLDYIEGWHAIAEANRIFGFDGWQRETVEMREVRTPEQVKSQGGKTTWRVGFVAKVRVKVGDIIREGTGYGSGALPDLGEAYESAVKEAETDAMKRALMTFGNPFGLALYDKERTNVQNSAEPESASEETPFDDSVSNRQAYMEIATQVIEASNNADDLRKWWKDEKDHRAGNGLTQADVDDLKAVLMARIGELTPRRSEAA